MTDQSQDPSITGPERAFAPFFQAAPHMQHLMLFAPRLQAAVMRAAIAQQKEAAAFLTRRSEEDLKLTDDIGKATTFMDLATACFSFWQHAATQYAQQAGQVAETSSRSAMDVVDELRSEASAAANIEPMRNAA